MADKEKLITGLRKQRELLSCLVRQLQKSKDLGSLDCHLYEIKTKEVETNLKKLRKLAVQELVKEISTQTPLLHDEEMLG